MKEGLIARLIIITVCFIACSHAVQLEQFSWGDFEGKNLLTWTQSQKSPRSCGSCWAMSTSQSLSDRLKIAKYLSRSQSSNSDKQAQYEISDSETIISTQYLLSCDDSRAFGCFGGKIQDVYSWVNDNGVVDETCSPYQTSGQRKQSSEACKQVQSCGQNMYYGIKDFGFISGEFEMMKEVLANGPIVCYMRTDQNFDYFTGDGVYIDRTGATNTDHAVSIVGWGQQNQVEEEPLKFWIARNTYGSFWGNDGFFKILRGENNAGIESECVWAIPRNLNFENPSLSAKVFKDWRNVDNLNFISPIRNLEFPKNMLAFSSIESAVSSIESRIRIWSHLEGTNVEVRLSLQSVINCIGRSNSNHPIQDVFTMAINQGIPDESCNSFDGESVSEYQIGDEDRCSGIYQCKYCYLPHYPFTFINNNCTAIPEPFVYKKYFIQTLREIRNDASEMESEITNRGPIICELDVSEQLLSYKGGILSCNQESSFKGRRIWVSVIGFGQEEETQKKFWIIKNNQGTSWGEHGFLRLSSTHGEDLNISKFCYYPIIGEASRNRKGEHSFSPLPASQR